MVRGATVQDRKVARARKASKSRVEHYGQQIKTAPTQARKLSAAFDFLRAVADDLGDSEKEALWRVLVRLADERNKR